MVSKQVLSLRRPLSRAGLAVAAALLGACASLGGSPAPDARSIARRPVSKAAREETPPSGEAEAADLLGQLVAARLVHAADHFRRERRDVLGRRARLGDEEVGVLLAHVRVPD